MDLATFHAIAALRPHPNRARCLRGDVTYCPLCGFFLPNEWDSHFAPCLARRSLEAWYHAAPLTGPTSSATTVFDTAG